MSKKEKINHDMDILKSVLKSILMAFFAICAFAFVKLDEMSLAKLILLLCGAIGLLFFGWIILKLYIKNGRELERL